MPLHDHDIPLEFDCPRRLADMPLDASGTRRYCSACEQSVHDLSAMTEQQARALLREHASGELCVAFRFRPDGRIRFADQPRLPATRLRPRPRVRMELAATALLASLVAVGCVGFTELEVDEPDELAGLDPTSVTPWADPDAPACPPADTPAELSPLEQPRAPTYPSEPGAEPIVIEPPREPVQPRQVDRKPSKPSKPSKPLPELPDDDDLEAGEFLPPGGYMYGRLGRPSYPALVDMDLLPGNSAAARLVELDDEP